MPLLCTGHTLNSQLHLGSQVRTGTQQKGNCFNCFFNPSSNKGHHRRHLTPKVALWSKVLMSRSCFICCISRPTSTHLRNMSKNISKRVGQYKFLSANHFSWWPKRHQGRRLLACKHGCK